MGRYEEGLKVLEESCCGKDNVISLSTIALETGENSSPRPVIRDVDAVYEDGVFYVTTYGLSNKIRQIEKNSEVAFCVPFGGISGNGIGENLGWVKKPENAEVREKVRKVFADWYDAANNEDDENCVILAIRLKVVTIFKDHGAVYYKLDLVNKQEIG